MIVAFCGHSQIDKARKIMSESCTAYRRQADGPIFAEMQKLEDLKQKHLTHVKEKYEQLSMFESTKERKRDQEERRIDDLFQKFFTWVEESMEIQDNPYIRIIAVFAGVKA